METNLSHFRVWALSRIKRCGVWSVGFIWIDLGWELCHVTGSQELLQYPCITSHSMWFSHILLYPFSGPHEVFHLMLSPKSMVKVPFNVHHRCLLQLSPSWVLCWRKIPCNVLQHAWHWMTATWAQCWQVWAIHRSLSNATYNWCSPGWWVMSSGHISYQRWNKRCKSSR